MDPESGSWPRLCQLACWEPQLDVCDVERIPLLGDFSDLAVVGEMSFDQKAGMFLDENNKEIC